MALSIVFIHLIQKRCRNRYAVHCSREKRLTLASSTEQELLLALRQTGFMRETYLFDTQFGG